MYGETFRERLEASRKRAEARAAKWSAATLYAVTLTGSTGVEPMPEDKLVRLATALTSKL